MMPAGRLRVGQHAIAMSSRAGSSLFSLNRADAPRRRACRLPVRDQDHHL